jgi:hypothetical protein
MAIHKENLDRMKAYHLILKYHGAGFWSIFNKLMNYLQHYDPIYKITWDVVSPFHTYGLGEVMGRIFEPYENPAYANYEIEDVICDGYINEILTGKQAAHLYTEQSRDENNIPETWRTDLNALWTQHIHIKEPVLARFTQFKEFVESMEKQTIICMLVRHPTLSYEQPNGKMPEFEQYDEVISKISPSLENTLIICMTDLQEAYDYFSEKYGDVILFPPTDRASRKSGEAFTSKQGDESSAMNALFVALNLSVGQHLIHHTSNIATAVLYINPAIESHFVVG